MNCCNNCNIHWHARHFKYFSKERERERKKINKFTQMKSKKAANKLQNQQINTKTYNWKK